MSTLLAPYTFADVLAAVQSFEMSRGHAPSYLLTDSETARALRDNLGAPIHKGFYIGHRAHAWVILGCEWIVVPCDGPFLKVVGAVSEEMNR